VSWQLAISVVVLLTSVAARAKSVVSCLVYRDASSLLLLLTPAWST